VNSGVFVGREREIALPARVAAAAAPAAGGSTGIRMGVTAGLIAGLLLLVAVVGYASRQRRARPA
jgi:hypothetical protein